MDTIRCSHCGQDFDATDAACPACGYIHNGAARCQRHPDCVADGICVMCGDPVCAACNSNGRVHFACPDHAAVPVFQGWAQIYSTADSIEADLIKENLQSEGMSAAVLSQKDQTFNVDLGDLSPVRILVPAYEYGDAVRVLTEHMDGRGEIVFACPACGEAFDTGDGSCRACGAALPTAAAGDAG